MSDSEWGSMDEKEFESLLEDSVSGLPPEDVVNGVTPWRQAMNRVLIGMALCTVTLNFLCLNYILPAVGTVLLLLGFRALRRENKWFRICFIITVIKSAYYFPMLILNTTVYHNAIFTSSVTSALTAVNSLLQLSEFYCLWQGLRRVQVKAGLPPRAGGAAALLGWYALICVLVLFELDGTLVAVVMLAAYVFILRNIYRLSKELDEAGYSVSPAPVRVTDRNVVLAIVSVLLIGCVLGCAFGNRYAMEWSAVSPSEQSEAENIRSELLALGFPEYVLNDLTPEEIEACGGATEVVVTVTDEPVNSGRIITVKRNENGREYLEGMTVYDVKELRVTGVAVRLPGERESWMLFHHFLWTTDPGFFGTEAIQLLPVYQRLSEGWASAGDVTGRVLYDDNGETFTAPYYSLGSRTFTSDSVFWGAQTSTDVFAEFSMPRSGENCRCYIAYPIVEVEEGYIISSWVNYTHQLNPLQYPAKTAAEHRMTNGYGRSEAFITLQDALQFLPTKDGVEMLD